jgi:hypothetical protein
VAPEPGCTGDEKKRLKSKLDGGGVGDGGLSNREGWMGKVERAKDDDEED